MHSAKTTPARRGLPRSSNSNPSATHSSQNGVSCPYTSSSATGIDHASAAAISSRFAPGHASAKKISATTLAASYGIYGPAFELCENVPVRPGSEEYLNSEKYQVRHWDRSAAHSIAPLIARLNQIRRTNPALQSDLSLHFHEVDNPQLIAYSKSAPGVDGGPPNVILTVVNLDPHNEQAGWVDLDLKQLGIGHDEFFDVEDLLTSAHYQWHDRSNYVALRPAIMPAHVLRVTRKTDTSGMLDIRNI